MNNPKREDGRRIERKSLFAILFAAALMVAGCNKESVSGYAVPTLHTNTASITFASGAAASKWFALTSNANWSASVTVGSEWCTISPESGTGSGSITVDVAQFTGIGNREAVVTITADTVVKTVTVTQLPKL